MKRKIFLFTIIFFIYIANLSVSEGQLSTDQLPAGVIKRFTHGVSVYTVAFSPDGQLLASGGNNNKVILWNVTSRSEQTTFRGHTKSVMSVAFSPNGKYLASASHDGFVRLWNVDSKRRHAVFTHTHTGWVRGVAFSPDGKMLASGGGNQSGSVMLWDVGGNRRIDPMVGHAAIVESVAFSPDGHLLASTSRDKTVKLWDVNTQQIRKNLTKHKSVVYAVAFSPDGRTLATSSRDYTIKLWSVSSGENFATLEIGKGRHVYAEALAFSPDGKHLAAACMDHNVILYDVDKHRAVNTLRGHDGAVTSVAFSPNGKHLASGSRDRTVLLWKLEHFNIIPSSAPSHVVVDAKPSLHVDPTPVPDPIVVDTTPPTVVDTTPPTIVIHSPTEEEVPQNTQELLIQGRVTDNNSISDVKVNGQEIWISAQGVFTATVPLSTGENEIRVTATDLQGNMDTNRFSVSRPADNPQSSDDLDPPKIFLNVPIHTETTAAVFTVQGSVIDNTGIGEVKVNNTEVSVSPDGDFTVTEPLSYGENEIRVTATDLQGNMDTNRFTLFRKSLPIDNEGPEIRILHPLRRGIRPEILINDASVTVSAAVTDASGVSEVKIDRTVVQRTGNRFTADILLSRGENVIRITASDTRGNDSEKEVIVFRPHSERKGKDYALLFAVEDYDHWTKLHKPVSDAETIQHDLETLYGFQTRLIKNPTQAGILKTIREYAEMDYTDDDQLFIFFAGHGYFDETFKGGYLVARDTQLPPKDLAMLSYVSHSVIRDIIDAMNCKHIFLVLDTCYSGTFDRLIAMRGNAADMSGQRLTEGDIHRKFQYTTRWYLTSGGKEIVYDESPFVHQFLEALRSKGGSDNILTIDEILSYVRRLVKPKPRASGFGSDEPGSDFLFFAIE